MGKKKAFTLIELLVVITIIMILAMVAMNAFGQARRSAQMDLAADSLVSALKMQQGLSKSGRVVDEKEGIVSKCYGMYFFKEPQKGEVSIRYVETPYHAVKDSKADFCDLESKSERDYETDAVFELFMIEWNNQERGDFLVLFKPPFARAVVGDFDNVKAPKAGFVRFGIRLPNATMEKYLRFDPITGLTERLYGEQT